jgi:hypothetical protein
VSRYRFVTTWRFEAPAGAVWEALREPEGYPRWWPGVEEVELLAPGEPDGAGKHVRITLRSRLPYRLRFEVVGLAVRAPDRVLVASRGELDGIGRWTIRQDGDVATATYRWDVATRKPWMNLVGPLLRPAFVWNHHVVMRWGAEGLARHLDVPLVGHDHLPPVRAADWSPVAGFVAAVAGVLLLRALAPVERPDGLSGDARGAARRPDRASRRCRRPRPATGAGRGRRRPRSRARPGPPDP